MHALHSKEKMKEKKMGTLESCAVLCLEEPRRGPSATGPRQMDGLGAARARPAPHEEEALLSRLALAPYWAY